MLTARTMVFSDACSPLHRASGCSGCGDTKTFLLSETNKPNRVHGTSPREEDDAHGGRDDGESATAETHLLTQLSSVLLTSGRISSHKSDGSRSGLSGQVSSRRWSR